MCPLQLLWISLIQQLWSLWLLGEDVKDGLEQSKVLCYLLLYTPRLIL